MQRVFVTGATGFIGAAVARALVCRGFDVAVLVRKTADTWRLGDNVQRMRVCHGSLHDVDSYKTALRAFRPDTVMHLAWHGVSKAGRDNPAQVRTNVCGSAELLWAAIGSGCTTFIGVGSQAEYGPCDIAIDEGHPPRPDSLYGAAKLATLTLLDQISRQHNIRLIWLRVFSVYGPQDTADTLLSSLIRQLLGAIRPRLTCCDQVWDYLFINDAAEAFVAVGASSTASGVFNVGSGEAQPLHETITQVRDLIDPSLPLGFGELPSPDRSVRRLEPIVSLLHDVTGWSARTRLTTGLWKTIEWHKQTKASSATKSVFSG
jgi:UDP-glucose 4-epimerase